MSDTQTQSAPSPLGGVIVAAALPYREDAAAPAGLAVDHDRYAEHCRWLVANGCRGVGPNGSLGEYSALTDEERRRVARTAVEAVGGDGVVVAACTAPAPTRRGTGPRSPPRTARTASCACRRRCTGPPRRGRRALRGGGVRRLPVMVYNNPIDTKVDLTPDLLAEIAQIDGVVAVKEFSGDVRRVLEIKEKAPGLEVVAGADDVVLESLLMGATGWFAGFPNVFPAESALLYDLATAGRLAEARALYEPLVAAFRWDSRTEFVQAIKLGMDQVGRYGGPCRPPRGPLTPEHRAAVTADMARAIDALARRRAA